MVFFQKKSRELGGVFHSLVKITVSVDAKFNTDTGVVSFPVAGMPGLLVVGQMLVDLVVIYGVMPGYFVGGSVQIVAVSFCVGSLAGVGGFVDRNTLYGSQDGRPGESSGMKTVYKGIPSMLSAICRGLVGS